MAPSRTSKSVYKRPTKEASPERNSSKTKQRMKRLTDKLGPQWTKGELERFYDAYRKHGRDWKKVAAAVRNSRSVDMVEALFNMNRAYLSLPEGTASVVGLIAMMTDHYSVIEESESESESEEEEGHKLMVQKRKHASAEGCLSFLKRTQAYGLERRAAGKRTPRFPVPSDYERDDREVSMPPSKRAKKQLEVDDDDSLALALANAPIRGGVSSPYRRAEVNGNTPHEKTSQAKEAHSKVRNVVRISLDRRHIKGAPDGDGALLMDAEGVGTVVVPQKGKNVRLEEAEGDVSDNRGEPSNANEGIKSGDDLEALHVLAELSAFLSPRSESFPRLKEDRKAINVDEKPQNPVVRSYQRRKPKQAEPEDSLLHAVSPANTNAVTIGELGTSTRKRKTLHNEEWAEDDNMKTMIKARRVDQSPPKQLTTAKTSEESSSISDKKITEPDAVVSPTQVSGSGPASLLQKPPNRRKISLKKSLQERAKSSEATRETNSKHELLKKQVSTSLSCPLVRRRCIYEWFYSAIDYPWFAKMEFIDFLNHIGLDHSPRLTRLEWSVIKSSLGRTRRFSEKFIHEEREKLKQYRESARKHYTELRTGAREVLPVDFAQPLSVGNRVIAIHPKTREVRDGKIITVDHDKCNVLFDDLGVDLVMDIDIMPLNPFEYMPDGLRRQIESKEAEVNRHPSSDASALFPPPVLENIHRSMVPPKKQDDMDRRVTTDQSYNIANNKARQTEIQRALMLEDTSDAEEMEPEVIGIVSGSRSIAEAMVDAAIKASSLAKNDKYAMNVVLQALNSEEAMTEGLMGSGKNETQIDSEIIAPCLSTLLMIQRCAEKQYPPADVAQVMNAAGRGLEPRCPRNMSIYRDILTRIGWIKNHIIALVKT